MDPEQLPSPEATPSIQPPAVNPFAKKQQQNQKKRLLLFGLGGLVILGSLIGIIYLGTRGGILVLEPDKDFIVTLNGNATTLNQQSDGVFIHTSPGLYRLQLSRANYEPFEADIKVERGQIVKIRPIFSVLPKTASQANVSVDYVRPSQDQKALFYLGNNRQTIYRVDVASQQQTPITSDLLSGVKNIEWSAEPDLALIVQGDGTYLQEIPRYDFVHQTKVKIAGPEVSSPVWDPTDPERLAFAYAPATGEHSLVFSDKRITTLDRKADISTIPNPKILWSPNSDSLLLLAQAADPTQRNLWLYTTTNGSLTKVTTTGNILDASYAPDGGTILYESNTSNGSLLSVMNPDGSNAHSLNIIGQVAKAAWHDSQSFYLPDSGRSNLVLHTLTGQSTDIPFSFPSSPVEGMYFFSASQTFIFYTSTSIYLSNLAK